MSKKIEPYKGIAGIYEEIRPSYPQELIDDVITKTKLKLEDNLLEIGAGTGKATLQFAERGFNIKAIEIGEDMAEILKDKCSDFPKVSVDIASFEEWMNPNSYEYDMIFCAQAFHWIDKNIKYKKCYDLLKDDGYLALFWYTPSSEELKVITEINERIDNIVNKYISSYYEDKGKPKRLEHDGICREDERKTEIMLSGYFELVEKLEYTYETKNNAEQYLKVLKSVPAYASKLDGLDEEKIHKMDNEIRQLINKYGGYVDTLFKFSLYIAKKSKQSI